MAKYETRLFGNFDEILRSIEDSIPNSSISASIEDGSNFNLGNVKCAVRVFERYSMTGSNRVSLSVTLVGEGDNILLSAITAGGSQAVFFKINTLGENAFLDCLVTIIDRYTRN